MKVLSSALVILSLLTVSAVAPAAQAYPPLKPGIVKVDTHAEHEDEQPRWTQRLARHGWDYNPGCDQQGERFDWFAPGQPCNERAAFVSGVGSAQIVGVV